MSNQLLNAHYEMGEPCGEDAEFYAIGDWAGELILSDLKELTKVKAQRDQLAAMLRELLLCPYTLDSASIPRLGIDANPEQVVGVLSIGIVRIWKAEALLVEIGDNK